jgi:hypothetical protein
MYSVVVQTSINYPGDGNQAAPRIVVHKVCVSHYIYILSSIFWLHIISRFVA